MDIQIPKNQYDKFVKRLGPSKANTRFKSNSKEKNQSEGLISEFRKLWTNRKHDKNIQRKKWFQGMWHTKHVNPGVSLSNQ